MDMSGTSGNKTLLVYKDKNGKEPFTDWLNGLKDAKVRRRILVRLRRLEQGNSGDSKHIRDRLYELRLFFGPGYRVYFGKDGDTVIVLLAGGDKSSQDKDILVSLQYWQDYRSNDKLKNAR